MTPAPTLSGVPGGTCQREGTFIRHNRRGPWDAMPTGEITNCGSLQVNPIMGLTSTRSLHDESNAMRRSHQVVAGTFTSFSM